MNDPFIVPEPDDEDIPTVVGEVNKSLTFDSFFWQAENFRQTLLTYSYGMNRRIEQLEDGSYRTVRYVFGPYGSGEPGSQSQPFTVEVSEHDMPIAQDVLNRFEMTLEFFKKREEYRKIREMLFETLLTDEQKESLKWITPDELNHLV